MPKHLSALRGAKGGVALKSRPATRSALPVYLKAPSCVGISHWLNTPGGRPLTIEGSTGRRTLPHLRALYAAYHRDGFEIVGVHTPEFAFEQVALDNDYGTRTAWGNRAFPPGIRAYSFTFG